MYVTPGFLVTDVGVVAMLIGFLFTRHQYHPLNIVFHAIFWPLAAIALLALLTAPFSLVPNLAWYTAVRWSLAVVLFLALFYINVPMPDVVRMLLASMTLQAIIGVIQAIAQRPLGLPGEMTLPLQNPDAAAIYVAGYAWLRSYGLTFNPNVLGGYLVSAVILSVQWLNRRSLQILWLVLGAGLFLTFSRSAWMTAIIVLPFLLWWYFRRNPNLLQRMRPVFIVAMVGVVILIVLFLPQIASRLKPGAALLASIRGRGEMINLALNSIKSDMFSGLGAGNFPVAMKSFNSVDPPQYVHNIVLLLAAEVGLIGGMLWLWLWIFPMVKLEARISMNNPWPILITATWFAWGLIGLWDSYPWALESGRLYTVTLLALLARGYQTEHFESNLAPKDGKTHT